MSGVLAAEDFILQIGHPARQVKFHESVMLHPRREWQYRLHIMEAVSRRQDPLKRRGSAVSNLSHRASLSLALAHLGRLLKAEPGAPSPDDPKFLPDDVPELTPDQLLEMRYGRGRADPRRSVR